MESATDLLNALPEQEGKQFENFTYNPVTVTGYETAGIVVVGILAIIMFIAYQRLLRKYLAVQERASSE